MKRKVLVIEDQRPVREAIGEMLEGEGYEVRMIRDGFAAAEAVNGGDAVSLYTKLEQAVLPLYHRDRAGWIRVMKSAIGKNGSFFNSHRMMRHYATGSYIR